MSHPSSSLPTLVIRASGGLSNRLQAVAAGVGHCLLSGRALCVDWRDGMYSDDFSNVFPRWFEVRGLPTRTCEETRQRAEETCPHPPFWKEWLPEAVAVEYLFEGNDHLSPENVARSSVDFAETELPHPLTVGWAWDLSPARRLAPLLRERLPRFAAATDEAIVRSLLVEHIFPAADLVAEANAFVAAHFAPTTVGIHIRHTDLQSPLEQMLRALREVTEAAGPDCGIFLATDNQRVEILVRRLFPRTLCQSKIFQGTDVPLHCYVPGISNVQKGREALLDMLLLARCQHITHYAPSSFARIPILLSGLGPEYIHAVS